MKRKTKVLLIGAVAALAILALIVTLIVKHTSSSSPDDTVAESVETSGTGDGLTSEESQRIPSNTQEEEEGSKDPGSDSLPEGSVDDEQNPSEPNDTPTEEPVTEVPTVPEPLAYDEYMTMSSAEQEAYFNSFPSVEAFFAWFNAAKEKYQAEHPGIEIGPGGMIP